VNHHAMPPSQLKRLKASLREQGIIGPQQSKKQKKQNAQNGVNKEKRVHRTVALNGIREQFNPFEFKAPSRKPKFEVTTENTARSVIRRPGVQKSQEEEMVIFWLLARCLYTFANFAFTASPGVPRGTTATT
jgi:nucleolar protein 14